LDRASTFSNPGIIQRLRADFIPFSGNCAELQESRSLVQQWFMRMADQTTWRSQEGNTTQGFYIAGADGSCYGWMNDRDIPRLRAFLDRGLRQFKERPPQPVAIPDAELNAAFTRTPNPATSVVRVFSRVRPVPEGADELNRSVGRDHLWILADEVRELLASAPHPDDRASLPRALVARMVRFHLIDNVRGEPDMWEADQVRQAQFTATAGVPQGDRQPFTFAGEFSQRRSDGRRGQEGTIHGELLLDTRTARVVRFRAYSEGVAWGESQFTPGAPRGRFPLVIAMIEAEDPIARTVPPQAIWMGREYLRPHLSGVEP
jgi:hypothetical protein